MAAVSEAVAFGVVEKGLAKREERHGKENKENLAPKRCRGDVGNRRPLAERAFLPGQRAPHEERPPAEPMEEDELLEEALALVPPSGALGRPPYEDSFDEEAEAERFRALHCEPKHRRAIHRYLREAEHRHRPHPHYMRKQAELTDDMRRVLVDWLVSISDEYEMAHATLHSAVSYVDRFLSKMSVVRSKFQLLGVSAMMIAAKYEEVHPPDVHEFSSLTEDTCSPRQILKMEELILRVLSFDLTTPTAHTFVEEYVEQARLSREAAHLAMFVGELCLVDSVRYADFLPSEVAASCVALARHTMDEEILWPKSLRDLCEYSLSTLYPVMKMQHTVFRDSPERTLQAVRTKYARDEFSNVTRYTPRPLIDEE